MKTYNSNFRLSVNNPELYWKDEAEKLEWFKFPKTILGKNENQIYEWFPDGVTNMSYLCLDRHVMAGRGEKVAFYYDSPVTGVKKQMTYEYLLTEVKKCAGVLSSFGVNKGDTVVIYMPMVYEAAVAMLACARIGAIHSVVFGGFSSHELKVRIDDCKPKVIISASCGIEVSKIIDYKILLDKAIELSEHQPNQIVYLDREALKLRLTKPNEYYWDDLMQKAKPFEDCVWLNGNDNLYLLYTSGTTAKPKGVLRQVGGYAVSMYHSMHYVYNCTPDDTYWAASDIGWVVGHSYIVYAPLIFGCSSVFYEGKPIKTPNPGAFWRVIQEYKVNVFFTAPTAFRAIKKEDPNTTYLQNYDISSLRTIFLAGERLDPPTLEWLIQQTNKPIYDHWWQTETGAAMVCNPIEIDPKPVKNGSSTFPVPGFQIDILDEEGVILPPNKEGYIAVRLPLPPGCLNTLWNGFEDFKASYLSRFEGYYLSGDSGYIDDDGYVFIMGRVDDVINISGHRLSTGKMEEIIGKHEAIVECAVVGIRDALRGQVPLGFFVVKDGVSQAKETIEKELSEKIRNEVGAVAVFKKSLQVKRLPKTRSGKILRKTLREIVDKEQVNIPSTIDDPDIIDEIRQVVSEHKIGRFSNLK